MHIGPRILLTIALFGFFSNCLAQTPDFRLWGTTTGGGSGSGTIFTIYPDGSNLIVPKIFGNANGAHPWAGVIQALDGDLYGVNAYGGEVGYGTIYKLKTDGTGFTTLYFFDGSGGKYPYGSLLQSSTGDLFGMTIDGSNGGGLIYKIKTDGTGFQTLHQFDITNGSQPQGGLIQATDGDLYGMTTQGGPTDSGIIFKIKTDGTGFTKLLDFSATRGRTPFGNLFQAVDGKLYGMTAAGGDNDGGVIFKINLDGSGYTRLINFSDNIGQSPSGNLIQGTDGKLYGMTHSGGISHNGVVFKINTDGSNYTRLTDFGTSSGAQPQGSLTFNASGDLFGMTGYGGSQNLGTAFTIKTNGTAFTKLLDFDGTNGSSPGHQNLFLASNGDFYSTTTAGGTSNNGVVFRLKQNGTYTKLVEYYQEIALDESALIQASNGDLYGMSAAGGLYGFGALFKIKKGGTGFVKLLDFDKTNTGCSPKGNLFEASNGDLFGLTSEGGTCASCGVIFKIKTDGTGFTKLHDFDFGHGANPQGSLIQVASGELFGTTTQGGASNNGVIFKIAENGTGFGVVFEFDATTSGQAPYELIQAVDGSLYGTCAVGGATYEGTLYKIETDGTGFIKLMDFGGVTKGSIPKGGLTQVPSGDLFGTTGFGGTSNKGIIFKIKTDGTGFNKLVDFTGSNGIQPYGGRMTLAPDNNLYGMTWVGGSQSTGVVFKIKSDGTGFSKILDLVGNSGTYPFTTQLLVITISSQTISFPSLSNKTFGDVPFQLSATATSSLPVTFVSSDPTVVSIAGNTATIVGAGTATIAASQSGDLAYKPAAIVQQTITVNKADQTITFNTLPSRTFGDGTFALSATSTSNLPVTYISSNLTVATISGSTVTITGAGATSITSNQVGNANYNPAPGVPQTQTVNKNSQTITFGSIQAKKFGDASFTLTATSTSGLSVNYSSGNTAVATISGSTVTIVGVGTSVITASQSGDSNYNSAADTPQTLTVSKGIQTITFASLPVKGLGDAPVILSASSTSSLPVAFLSGNTSVATINGNTLTIVGLGTATINASQAGDANYNSAADVQQTLTVKNNQTITFGSLPIKTIGDASFTLSAISTSGLPLTYSTSNPAVGTISGNTLSLVGVGTSVITASQSGNANYNAATDVTQTLTVSKANQSITFTAIPTKTFGDASVTLSATSSSGLPLTYTSGTLTVATVSNSVMTIVGAGTSVITASQSGTTNYAAAANVTQTLTVSKASQTIAFTSIPTKTFGDSPFNLSATATSGLGVQFSTPSDKVTISGNQVTLTRPGSVTIKADQAGNGNFNAATSTSQTFCINPVKPTITTTGLNSSAPVLTSSSTAGNQWYRNGTAITDAASTTFTASQGGIYTVKVTTDNCVSELSAELPLVVTGDIAASTTSGLRIFPNPAKNVIIITSDSFDPDEKIEIVIYDMSGKAMDRMMIRGRDGISLISLAPGEYILKAAQSGHVYVARFVKE